MALTESLTNYWKLDGNSNDVMGVKNGTDTSMSYANSNGIINQGGSFNGTTGRVSFSTDASGNAKYTVAGWIKPTSFSSTMAIIQNGSSYGASGTWSGWQIFTSTTTGTIWSYHFKTTSTYINPTTTTALTSGVWNWFAVVYDGTNHLIYINGVASPKTTACTTDPTWSQQASRSFSIGVDDKGNAGSPAQYFNGSIDEIGYWNRALSADELGKLYRGGAGLTHPFIEKQTNVFTKGHLGAY